MDKLDNIIFYNLEKTIKSYRQFAQANCLKAGVEITIDQWLVLKTIGEYPDITQLVATAFVRAAYWSSKEENIPAYIEYSGRIGTSVDDARQEITGNAITWKDRWSPLFDSELRKHYAGVNAYAAGAHLVAIRSTPISFMRRSSSTGHWPT